MVLNAIYVANCWFVWYIADNFLLYIELSTIGDEVVERFGTFLYHKFFNVFNAYVL